MRDLQVSGFAMYPIVEPAEVLLRQQYELQLPNDLRPVFNVIPLVYEKREGFHRNTLCMDSSIVRMAVASAKLYLSRVAIPRHLVYTK